MNETSKKDQEKLIADNCELKKEVEVQRQILHTHTQICGEGEVRMV